MFKYCTFIHSVSEIYMIWIHFLIIISLIQMILLSLVSKGDNKVVLWPEYFDNSLTKSAGRRVPRKLAISNPTVEDIAKAAKKLKLNPKIEHDKSFPGRWWRKTGRISVQRKLKKAQLINQIGIVMKKSRRK